MNELTKRFKETLARKILDIKQDKLDEHFMTSSRGSFTRRELAKEILDETEVGIQQMESMLNLTIFLLEKGKETI